MKKTKPILTVLAVSFFVFACGREIIKKQENNISRSDIEISITPSVVDGDSITKKIRLYGIDAPEYSQKYGIEARNFLINLVKNKNVICFKYSHDRYGRTVAECYADDVNVNAAMVKNGFAWAYRKYSNHFNKLEDYARRNKLGLWQDDDPLPPWEYRRQKR